MFGNRLDESYYGEFKTGLFGKKTTVSLYIYKDYIRGTGEKFYDGDFHSREFEIKHKHIVEMRTEVKNNVECLAIVYVDNQSIIGNNKAELFFPNLKKADDAIACIQNKIDELKAEEQKNKERVEQRRLEEAKKRELCEKFYADCYDFHIGKDDNPYYELQRDGLLFACIYIDKNKNLNFLKFDGNHKEENNAYIPYDKIHYYEKAGSIHYTTDISGKFSSFGGSITGSTISKAGTILGGLLLGPMGMAAGAVLTYKPQNVTLPDNNYELSSETKTIDDRSVILNFFSDAKRQYIDIELPADIYNFLQTHYPEKKYDIVLELEKETAVKEQKQLTTVQEKTEQIPVKDDMDSFENKVKKLKLMYDNGLLTDEEFAKEKERLLAQI